MIELENGPTKSLTTQVTIPFSVVDFLVAGSMGFYKLEMCRDNHSKNSNNTTLKPAFIGLFGMRTLPLI